jgi:secondary thiamine-phosphate synthase enzyme
MWWWTSSRSLPEGVWTETVATTVELDDNGAVDSIELIVGTGRSPAVVDITDDISRFVASFDDGLLSVFVPHATAGVAVIEVGSGSEADLLTSIDDLLPPDATLWDHEHGTRGHGRDHVLPAWIAPSLTVPVIGGRPALGTWQSIVLVDTNRDNPERRVRLSFLPG